MKQINKAAKKFRKDLDGKITMERVRQYITQCGYEIVSFSSEDTEIFKRLGIATSLASRMTFTYIGNEKKIVFINPERCKIAPLLVEAAHIALGHVAIKGIVGNTDEMNSRALLFASTVLGIAPQKKTASRVRVAFACSVALAVVGLVALIFSFVVRQKPVSAPATQTSADISVKQVSAETHPSPNSQMVYVTKNGDAFHLEECRYATTAFPISYGEAVAHGYVPCRECMD